MRLQDKFYEILQNPKGILLERGKLARLLRRNLSVFVVNSGNWARYSHLTLNSANEFPYLLSKLTEIEELSFENFEATFPESNESKSLGELFDSYGSDKTSHGYERIYTKLFETFEPDKVVHLLEIGLGTNSPGLISSMGRNGRPGASLRAFSKYNSTMSLTGADIDREILFNSESINCFFLDQTKISTYYDLSKEARVSTFDVIIDDGLHSTSANINSLIFAQTHLSIDGYLIIEDIPDRTIPVWKVVISILRSKGHDITITRALKCNVVIFRRKY